MYGRREVLRAGAAIGLLAASPWLSAAAPASMLSRPIPSTDERLPVIGAGTSGSFEVAAGSADYRQLYQVLEAFFAGGGRVIDTSPNYGGADSILGQLLDEGGGTASASLPPRSPPTAAQMPRPNGPARCAACARTAWTCYRCTTCVTGSSSYLMHVNSSNRARRGMWALPTI